MTTAYLVCDLVENHPSCIDGASYYRPWALVYDSERALTMARGNEALVYEMNEKEAQEMYNNSRITV